MYVTDSAIPQIPSPPTEAAPSWAGAWSCLLSADLLHPPAAPPAKTPIWQLCRCDCCTQSQLLLIFAGQSGWGRTFFDQSGQAPSQQQRVQRARQAVYGCRPGEETYDCLELAPPSRRNWQEPIPVKVSSSCCRAAAGCLDCSVLAWPRCIVAVFSGVTDSDSRGMRVVAGLSE